MKRALFFAGILCAATVCFAQGDRGLWGGSYAEKEEFEIKNSGVINIDGIQTGFHMTVHDKAWKQSGQTDRLMIPEKGFPRRKEGGYEFSGKFTLWSGIQFDFAETILREGKNCIRASYTLKAGSYELKQISLRAYLKHERFVKNPLLLNGKEYGFGVDYKEKQNRLHVACGKNILEIRLERGILKIEGKFGLALSDERQYKMDTWALYLFGETRALKAGQDWNLKLKMTFVPYKQLPLNLRKTANLGFQDSTPGDGKGGWTDQGPGNDLSAFPVSRKIFSGVKFDIIDPSSNSGKSCIGLFDQEHAPFYPPSATLKTGNVQGKYLYLLHALGWAPKDNTETGTIEILYEDGSRSEILVVNHRDVDNFHNPRRLENAQIGWSGRNHSARIGLYLTGFPIKSKVLKSLTFRTSGKGGIWMIVGATVTDSKIPFFQEEIRRMAPNADWKVMKHSKKYVKGSILDFSDFLDAPAGKYGRVVVRNGRFEFAGRPGIPLRFWGTNITYWTNFMDDSHIDKLMDACAFMGYNLIRFHHFDRDLIADSETDSTVLAPNRMDRMDSIVAKAKERGIYLTLDFVTLHPLAKGEVAEFPDETLNVHEFKTMIHFSPSAMKIWETFALNMMNHINPYTKLAWKDEPAIAFVSLVNEDAILGASALTPRIRKLIESRFEEYCRKRNLTVTYENRENLWNRFMTEHLHRGYKHMVRVLRDAGCRFPITSHNNNDSCTMSAMRTRFDYADTHFYFQAPTAYITPYRAPMYVDSRSSVGSLFSGENHFSARLPDKPFVCTEWDFVNPSPHAAEGGLLMSAYAALNGWSGLCHFQLLGDSERDLDRDNRAVNLFTAINNPLMHLSLRAGPLFFLRKDVKEAKESVLFCLPSDFMKYIPMPERKPEMVDQVGMICKAGTLVFDPSKPVSLPSDTLAGIVFPPWQNRIPGKKIVIPGNVSDSLFNVGLGSLAPYVKDGRISSMTGELVMDRGKNIFSAITPRSEAFILPEGKAVSGNVVSVRNQKGYGIFLISSRDGKDLNKSSRILLLHLTDVKNSGQVFSGKGFSHMLEWGKPPMLLRHGKAEIHLNLLQTLKLYACDTTGKRLFEIPLKENRNGKKTFLADNYRGNQAILVYELTKESLQH